MYIARILYPVKVLGPGCRVGIWFAGCRHACKGCSNPELWEFNPACQTSVAVVTELIAKIRRRHPVEGFTVTGGEPFEQSRELAELLTVLTAWSEDILLYSGYELSELTALNDPAVEAVLQQAAVLIDGRYQEEKNENISLRGSSNQKIHFLKENYREKYERYLSGHQNEIQNFTTADGESVLSVGIHRTGFKEALSQGIQQQGLEMIP